MAVGVLLLTASVFPLAYAPFPPGPPRSPFDEWMTGGGFIDIDSTRVTHGFELRCAREPNNLEVNWDGNSFHLTNLTSVTCKDNPNINEYPPDADFDTIIGTGVGRYNGQDGATVEFKFTDTGEPGTNDFMKIKITYGGIVVLDVAGYLDGGNQQAHEATPKDNV